MTEPSGPYEISDQYIDIFIQVQIYEEIIH